MATTPRAVLLSLGYVLVTCGTFMVAARPAGSRAFAYLVVHVALTILMLLAWRTLRSRGDLVLAMVAGVVARASLIGVDTITTTDVPRYLWDGAVLLGGHDPYALPPLAEVLVPLRATVPLPSDHLDVATCYPPLALALFALASCAGPSTAWWLWKFFTFTASALTAQLTWRALRDTERPYDAVLCAWSPLLVLEGGVGAHLDVFVALGLAASVVWINVRRPVASALAVGAVIALKFVPAVVLLPLACRAPRPVWYVVLALAPVAFTMAIAELLGLTAPGSLPYVAENWSFAAPLWTWLYAAHPLDDETIRAALGLGSLTVIALVSLRSGVARNVRDGLRAHLATTPALYPWYGTSLVAVGALAPSMGTLLVVTLLPFSYEVIDGYQREGIWAPARWPLWLNGLAMLLGLSIDGVKAWRRWDRS